MTLLLSMLAAASMAGGDIRPLLREQGFGAPLNGREDIAYVGTITQGDRDYAVYLYRGVHRAADVDHGVNRLIVILNGSTFLGNYAIPTPTTCVVRDQRVACNTENADFIQFTQQGPPRETLFDGEVVSFGRF